MEKKESRKVPGIKDPTFENKKLKASTNSNNKKDKSLPWWSNYYLFKLDYLINGLLKY